MNLYSGAVTLILFDIDGTLLSAKGAGSRALTRALFHHYGVENALDGLRLDGKTDPLIVREALQKKGFEHRFEGALNADFRSVYAAFLREELQRCIEFRVLPGVVELLAWIRQSNRFQIGLATGNVEEGAWLKVEKACLQTSFAFGGFGSDAENRTQVVLKAIERARALGDSRSSRVIVVGDTPRDILHGREAGAETVAVATGHYSLPELRGHNPTLAVESLHPVPSLLHFLSGDSG